MSQPSEHERFSIPHAEDLFSDTWAEECLCPNCGRVLDASATSCPACRQWIGECAGSCPGCPSPKCVGGDRPQGGDRR